MKKNLKALKKRADKWFSYFIRLRDSNEAGIGRCISCKRYVHWKNADNGHFIKRQYLSTRYDERNCALQCTDCNWLQQGNDAEFEKALARKHGNGAIDLLKFKKACERRNTVKLYDFEYLDIIDKYKKKVREIRNGR